MRRRSWLAAGLASLLTLTGTVAVADEPDPAGAFEAAGPLVSARSGHTATRLADGRILSSGGSGPDGVVAEAEIWDPTTGISRPTGSLIAPLAFKVRSVLLSDGRVLVSNPFMSPPQIWDPSTETFGFATILEVPNDRIGWVERHLADMGVEYGSLDIAPLADGRALISGGFMSGEGSDRIRTWAEGQPELEPVAAPGMRIEHSATLLEDGRVLLVGGMSEDWELRAHAWVVDPANDTTATSGALAHPRTAHTATPLPDGGVLIVGGMGESGELLRQAELWDPSTGEFRFAGELNEPRFGHTATALEDGRVLVAGGAVPAGQPSQEDVLTDSTEVWTPRG